MKNSSLTQILSFSLCVLFLTSIGCASKIKPPAPQEALSTRKFQVGDSPEIRLRHLTPELIEKRTSDDFRGNRLLERVDVERVRDQRVRALWQSRNCFEIESRGGGTEAYNPLEWSGDLYFPHANDGRGEMRPLVMSRYEPLACSEAKWPTNQTYIVRLRTPFIANDSKSPLIALFAFGPDESTEKELVLKAAEGKSAPVGSALSLELLSTDLKAPRMQAIMAAIRSGQRSSFEAQLQKNANWAPFDFVMMGGIAAAIASQGPDCYEDLILATLDAGAELSSASVNDPSGYLRTQVYACPVFAREMYVWVPSERESIVREARSSLGAVPGKTIAPERLQELERLIEKERSAQPNANKGAQSLSPASPSQPPTQ